jgi:hypothetical protein
MPSDRPYPGQLWMHESTHVIVVAVHPTTVTYEFLSGGQSVTQSLDVFLAVFSGADQGQTVAAGGADGRLMPTIRHER